MRLRHIIIMGGITFAIGGAVWLYDNAGTNLGAGEGGLPLIKANTNPIRTEPDDPGGEVIPHADSTVFAAMSRNQDTDPSMAGLKLPSTQDNTPAQFEDDLESDTPTSPEFAGLNTGFALPNPPQPKVESLFTTDEPEATAQNRYVGGIAPLPTPEPIAESQPETANPEPAQTSPNEEINTVDNSVNTSQEVIEEKVEVTQPPANTDQAGQAARAMEEQEKQVIATQTVAQNIIPTAKPPVPLAPAISPTTTPQPKEEQAPVRAAPKPAPEPITPPATPPAADRYVIQLASMPSRQEAERSWMQMQSYYPEALRGLSPSYIEAEIPGRGTFTRLRAGTLPRAEANARCEQIRREDPRGGGCLVIRE